MTLGAPPWLPEAFLLFLIFFGPLAFGAVEPWSLAILEIAAFLMLFFSSARGFAEPKAPVYQDSMGCMTTVSVPAPPRAA